MFIITGTVTLHQIVSWKSLPSPLGRFILSCTDVGLYTCRLPQVCGPTSNSCFGFGSAVQPRTLRGQHSPENAARERSRVRNLRQAFHSLQVRCTSADASSESWLRLLHLWGSSFFLSPHFIWCILGLLIKNWIKLFSHLLNNSFLCFRAEVIWHLLLCKYFVFNKN